MTIKYSYVDRQASRGREMIDEKLNAVKITFKKFPKNVNDLKKIDRGDGKVNTCRLKVSREDMRSLKLPLPSVEEQREIVQYLDKKRVDIDTLISKKQQFIDELTAYKKSLIYEFVTGKKEVPA